MQYFPLFYDLNGKNVLVVGGGDVATRKVDMLVRAGARVTIVSPQLTSSLHELVDSGVCQWLSQPYSSDLMTGFVQAWAATDDSELNHQVHKNAKSSGVMVNVVDDKPYCDFITPSVVNRGRIQVAISSGGASPVLVRNIRKKIEMLLEQNISLYAEYAARKRQEIQDEFATVAERRAFWERFFDDKSISLVSTEQEIDEIYYRVLQGKIKETVSHNWIEFGEDVELISIKTLRIMQLADIVYYPTSCPFDFVDLCRRDADRVEYQDLQQLSELLTKKGSEEMRQICIFIPKGDLDVDDLKGINRLNNNLFKVVG